MAEAIRVRIRNPTIDAYVPHPKQVAFHKSDAPGRQFVGGNRSGKTVGGAAEAVFYAIGRHPFKELPWKPPLRLRVVTVDFLEGLDKIVLPEIRRWVPPSELIRGSWEKSWSEKHRTLTLANGSFIEFMSYEQTVDKFAGTSRHGIWFDEEPPKEIFIECMLRLLDVNGHWWMTMTPVEGMTWTYDEIFESDNPNIEVFIVDMDDNPYLSSEGKAIVLAGLSDTDILARKKGQYVNLGGLIYKDFDFDKGIIDPLMPPAEWMHFAGMDHGLQNPTCWLWATLTPNRELLIYDEYYERDKIVLEHALTVKSHELGHSRPPNYRVGDPSISQRNAVTGTSIQLEYMRNGIPIILGNNDVTAGINAVLTLMKQDRLFITRNCRNTIWEMKRYRWRRWEHKKTRMDKDPPQEPVKKNDHAMDTLRYMVASRPELAPESKKTVPSNTIGASEAIDPAVGLRDKELSSIGRPEADFHLGEDY